MLPNRKSQSDVVLGWESTRWFSAELAKSVFAPGQFIKDPGLSKTVHLVGFEIVVKLSELPISIRDQARRLNVLRSTFLDASSDADGIFYLGRGPIPRAQQRYLKMGPECDRHAHG